MGLAPIFGKAATLEGVDPYSVAAWRTLLAALLLWLAYAVAFRRYLYIFPAGLLGTTVVGVVNGIGSLLFYNGLTRLDASLAQLLYMLYLVFAVLLTRAYGQLISRVNVVRAAIALSAIVLLTGGMSSAPNWPGVAMMLGSALMYALHVVLSQRAMYEMPAPTMALYALSAMAVTVTIAWLIHGRGPGIIMEPLGRDAWTWLAGLTLVTALSRLTLFAGVKYLGSLQTILLNVAELFVTLLAAFVLFSDRLTTVQWIGAGLLVISILLAHWDRQPAMVRRPFIAPPAPDEVPISSGIIPDALRIFRLPSRR